VKPIRLLHFITSLERGGAQAVLQDLLMHLDPQRFIHIVLYIHDGPYVDILKARGVQVQQVTGLFFVYDPIFFIRLFFTVKRLNPDCLHTLLWMANNIGRVIAKLLRIPCVSVLHNNLDQDGLVRNCIDRITLLFADAIVAVSDGVADSFMHAFSYSRDILVIPNGIDTVLITSKKVAQPTSFSGFPKINYFVIGSVGRLVPVKNYSLLLDSFAILCQKHAHIRLVLVGQGLQEQMLLERAQRLQICEYVTFVTGQQAYGYYPLFDCFVQTSDKEGISIALLEAMSFGLACVATADNNKHPVLEHEKTGILTSIGDCQQLAHAIERLILDANHRSYLGNNAQILVKERFDVRRMTYAYEKLFLEKCDQRR